MEESFSFPLVTFSYILHNLHVFKIVNVLIDNASVLLFLLENIALARVPAPVRGAQCATQAGIEGLAVCLRQELRPRGVDVAVVAAGEFAAGTAWLSESSMLEQVNKQTTNTQKKRKKKIIRPTSIIPSNDSIFLLICVGSYNVGTIER